MSCFAPPYQEAPPGKWICPECPPAGLEIPEDILHEQSPELEDPFHEPPPATDAPFHEPALEIERTTPSPSSLRDSSVASSSRHALSSDAKAPTDHNFITDISEPEVDPIGEPTPRNRTRDRTNRKGKQVARQEGEDEETSPVTPMPPRRLRIRVPSPAPTPVANHAPSIRLRVPARGKGKAREDAPEEPEHGLFDEILSVEDRDVRETSIKDNDMLRFEHSRTSAEVRSVWHIL